MSLLTIQEALNKINGSTGLTQQEAANELAVAVAAVASSGALTLTNTTTDNTISVDQNGNVGTSVSTDGAIHIDNTGNTGIGLGVYTDIGSGADAELVSIKADNTAFDQTVVNIVNDGVSSALKITQGGALAGDTGALYINSDTAQTVNLVKLRIGAAGSTSDGLVIYQDGNGSGLSIIASNAAATNKCISITNATAGDGLYVAQSGINSGDRHGLYINATGTQTVAPVKFRIGTATASAEVVFITNDGTGPGIKVTSVNAEAPHFNLTGDPTNATPADGDIWFDGTNLKICVGSTVSTFDMTPV